VGVKKIRIYENIEPDLGTVIRRIKTADTAWVRVEIPCWVGEVVYSPKSTAGYFAVMAPEGVAPDATVSTDGELGDGYLTVSADSFLTAPVQPSSWIYIAGSADAVHELLMTKFRGSTDGV
jgi:hypothetical protein